MKLSKKVFILWAGRLLFVSFAGVPLLSLKEVRFYGIYFLFLCINLFVYLILYLRFKFCTIIFSEDHLVLKTGFLIKKRQTIPLKFICTTRILRTPLSLALGLYCPVLYCEGVRTILPPLTQKQYEKFEFLRTRSFEA